MGERFDLNHIEIDRTTENGFILPGAAVVLSHAPNYGGHYFPGDGFRFHADGSASEQIEEAFPRIDTVISDELIFEPGVHNVKFYLTTVRGAAVSASILPETLARGAMRWYTLTDERNRQEGRGLDHYGAASLELDESAIEANRQFTDLRLPETSVETETPWVVINSAEGTGAADGWTMMSSRAYYDPVVSLHESDRKELVDLVADAFNHFPPMEGEKTETYNDRTRIGNWQVTVDISEVDRKKAAEFIVAAFNDTKIIQRPEDILYG